VRISDDSATGDGKYKRFNPPVFAWNPAKCMNTAATNAQPDGKVCNKSNNVDNGNYSGYSIHVTNKDKRRADDKPADKQLTVFGPVSAMEKTTCLDSNDTIRIILTSSSGTHEIKITNVLNNTKPLIYDITDKPVNIRDLKNIISQNECDYSPLLINKMNSTCNVTNSMNPQNNNCTNILITNTENDCKPIIKNNETNDTTDIKNTSDLKDPSYLNESTHNQTVTICNKNATTNNNKNQTTETVITTMVTQNNTELTNTTNTSGKINNITIENGNNGTKTPDRTEKCTKDQQNDCSPAVIGSNDLPITKNTDKNQTQITNTTQTNAENSVCSNGTHTDKKSEKNNTITTETKNNTTTSIPNNCQSSSNPISESNTTPVIQNNNNQTETNNTTTINNASNVNANTTDSNTTNAYKKPKPDEGVTMETRNNTTTDPKNNQNCSNPVIEGSTVPITKGNNDQTATKNATTPISASNVTASTTDSTNTNAHKKPEPDETITMETKNNTTTDPKNNQNSSNPANESNTIPVTKNDNGQTETKNATAIISAPNVTANTTDSTNNSAYKKLEPDHTDNDTVTTEVRDNTIIDPNHTAVVADNPQNDSNPVVESDEIPAITNTSDYRNPAKTVNATVSTPNYVENTTASNSRRTNDDTYTGRNEDSGVVNSAETIQTSETEIASDADDVGPTKNPDTISETKTEVTDDESTDVYGITTTGTTEPTPIYTEIIKTPNNGSMTNNATKIVNIIVY